MNQMSISRSLFKLPTLVDPKNFILSKEASDTNGFLSNPNSIIRTSNSNKKTYLDNGLRVLKNWSKIKTIREKPNMSIIKNEYIQNLVNLPIITLESMPKGITMEEKQINTTVMPDRNNPYQRMSYDNVKILKGKKLTRKGKDILNKMDRCELVEKSPIIGFRDMSHVDLKFILVRNKRNS
jgi:hypothetical protein